MGTDEMRTACERLLAQAWAVRVAYPDEAAMQAVEVTPPIKGIDWPDLRAALRYLWQEMSLVRSGGADSVGVLDDEIANVEKLLSTL